MSAEHTRQNQFQYPPRQHSYTKCVVLPALTLCELAKAM